MKKRAIAIVLALLLLLSLCACGEDDIKTPDAEKTAQYLLSTVSEPQTGSMSGEWLVFGLARYGVSVPEGYFESYYSNLEAYVTECSGVLSDRKYTEFSRVIIAVTALGKDPTNITGYDLLVPLANYERTVFQGINGAVYALLALDCGNYEIPALADEGTQATREMYVDFILSHEISGGGWSFTGGEAEVDMTAMVLQALAKYTDREDVSEAVERGVTFLSQKQQKHGGFADDETESCETISQVIVAICELGIGIDDTRFVKNGNTLLNRFADFMTEDGGFRHALDEGEANPMATEQAFYALVALSRIDHGKASLYDMSDVM